MGEKKLNRWREGEESVCVCLVRNFSMATHNFIDTMFELVETNRQRDSGCEEWEIISLSFIFPLRDLSKDNMIGLFSSK